VQNYGNLIHCQSFYSFYLYFFDERYLLPLFVHLLFHILFVCKSSEDALIFSLLCLVLLLNMESTPDEPLKWNWRKLFQYFLQGLVILAPIAITAWAVISLFNYIDNILPSFIHAISPVTIEVDENGNLRKIPGLGFLVVIAIVIVVGWISSSYIVSKVVDFFGHVLERTPGVKFIYTSVKDFLEAFAGDKRKFDKPVLVNVDGNDVWRMGFMTHSDFTHFGLTHHVVVYVPHSYALSGIVYIVPVEKTKLLTEISSTQAMKFAVSGGVAEINEHVIT